MEIISEPDWKVLFHKLLQNKGTALIIGATDSGKSTLAKYLIDGLVSHNINVCFIDSDVGQSSLGLPGTICMKVFSTESDLRAFSYEKISFIGTINPAKRISHIINTVKMISDTCIKISDITLIDTSGLVSGEIGERLKTGKISALNPNHIIAVQRQNELEHILSLISDIHIHRIIVSNNIKARPLATRIQYRKKKYDDYFRESEMNDFILYSNDATFLYNSKTFSMREGLFKKNTVIGLNHNDDTIALGILEDISDNSITFSSPLNSIRYIDRIIFGDITI
jgi:polynucleotide 5'-hydroxyl-kinase GRC3/NOL9